MLHQCAGVQTHRRQLLQLAGLTAVLGATQSAAPAHAASVHLLSPPRSKNHCCHTACKTAPQGALAAPVDEAGKSIACLPALGSLWRRA